MVYILRIGIKLYLGIYGRKSKKIALFYVENRSSNTLIPLILENIPINSTIISDKYSTYVNIRRNESRLERYNTYHHYWVNHSQTFVDHYQDFIHSNSIERKWRSLRNSISTIKRSFSPHILQQYLDTFIMKSMIKEKELFELMMLILGNMKEIVNKHLSEF